MPESRRVFTWLAQSRGTWAARGNPAGMHQPTETTGRQMKDNRTGDRRNALSNPLTLRNGIVLPNRLAKAATSEHLANHRGAPTNQLVTAYRALALSGTGLLISGNVMVDGAA